MLLFSQVFVKQYLFFYLKFDNYIQIIIFVCNYINEYKQEGLYLLFWCRENDQYYEMSIYRIADYWSFNRVMVLEQLIFLL